MPLQVVCRPTTNRGCSLHTCGGQHQMLCRDTKLLPWRCIITRTRTPPETMDGSFTGTTATGARIRPRRFLMSQNFITLQAHKHLALRFDISEKGERLSQLLTHQRLLLWLIGGHRAWSGRWWLLAESPLQQAVVWCRGKKAAVGIVDKYLTWSLHGTDCVPDDWCALLKVNTWN